LRGAGNLLGGEQSGHIDAVGFEMYTSMLERTIRELKGEEVAGSHSSVYRFHLDSPLPFTKSLRATIEHGTANDRADDYYSVAYWYQKEPHAPFPSLPPVEERIPKFQPTGGPGQDPKMK
jgi:hypothetical protein